MGNQRSFVVADQVGTARILKQFFNQRSILRLPPLKHGALLALVAHLVFDEDFLHPCWIESGPPHTGGRGSRSRNEILNLLGTQATGLQELGDIDCC